jgi:hypothetical protein
MILTMASAHAEQENPPELPIGRFLKSTSLGGNRVILVVRCQSVLSIPVFGSF